MQHWAKTVLNPGKRVNQVPHHVGNDTGENDHGQTRVPIRQGLGGVLRGKRRQKRETHKPERLERADHSTHQETGPKRESGHEGEHGFRPTSIPGVFTEHHSREDDRVERLEYQGDSDQVGQVG